MGRTPGIVITTVAVLLLTGCLSSEPKIAEIEQVAAAQREQMLATEDAGGEDGGGGGAAVWVAIDLAYPEAPTELPAGSVDVELDNQGAIEHNVVIEELDDQLILEAPGGGTDSATVDFEPGEYTYYCSIAGHRAAGMEGTMTVTG